MRMTDRFLAEIRRSHRYTTYVDVISPDNKTVRLPAIDGSVKCDRTATVRRTISVKCVDPDGRFTPRDEHGILTPFGTLIKAYRGVVYDDGTTEVAPLGVFRLSKSSIKDSVGGAPEIDLEGSDFSRTVSRDKFTVPYTVEQDTNILDAIKDIIARTFPDATYDAISTTLTATAPQVFDAGKDPWDAVTTLASSMAAEIYFDVTGNVVVAPPPDINSQPAPDFTYVEGNGCTMLDLSRDFSDENAYNGVIVTGESAGDEKAPVRGEAWDEDPTSPTYRFGPYGEVPQFVTNSVVKTDDDAEAMAKSLLADNLGSPVQLDITATVNPSYEGGDVVQVKRARSAVDGLYTIDAFDVPLSASGSQSLTLRQKQVS